MSADVPLRAIRDRLATRLCVALPGSAAQRRLAPQPVQDGWSPEHTPETARHAAVLLLVYDGPGGPALPLTLRHATLPSHAGQVSLPGGALGHDESPEAAAVRETHEEIGIAPESIHVLGRLSTLWVPVSNFVITPIVGVATAPPTFHLRETEVEALIEAPLARLLDAGSIQWTWRQRGDERIAVPYFDVGGHAVWGATAMILSEFTCLLDPEPPPAWR